MQFQINLNLQEVNTVLAALDELPRKIGNPVYTVIAQQAVAQEQAQQAEQTTEAANTAE
jgi:hypothetical protein